MSGGPPVVGTGRSFPFPFALFILGNEVSFQIVKMTTFSFLSFSSPFLARVELVDFSYSFPSLLELVSFFDETLLH